MDYVINQVPLEMMKVSGLLFNSQFLSDVTFIVDGKQIFAHSLELMKRSAKFLKQLEPTLGEKTQILITDYGYDVFYQFIRFIYTDMCYINDGNSDALLNLAKQYQVPELINIVKKYKNIEFEYRWESYTMKQIFEPFSYFEDLSDITFVVEGKEIYAHSLELMKRSSVFQEQLESTMGKKKRVPISDYRYDIFFEFIIFIYTDKCDVTNQNCLELFKLAIAYKIIRLVNFLQNSLCYDCELLQFCGSINDPIALFATETRLAENVKQIIASEEFATAHHDTVAAVLKFQLTGKGISERNKVDALVRWMEQQCTRNKIEFSDCRQKFDRLIRLVRFPTMSSEELRNIEITYPNLLTKCDIRCIKTQKLYGPIYESAIFNHTPLLKLPYLQNAAKIFTPTKFSVGTEMVLSGIIIGKYKVFVPKCWHAGYSNVNLMISRQNSEVSGIKQTLININVNNYKPRFTTECYGNVICLGLIRIRPGFTYIIELKYDLSSFKNMRVMVPMARPIKSEVIINAPKKLVNIIEADRSMIAMHFLKPDGTYF